MIIGEVKTALVRCQGCDVIFTDKRVAFTSLRQIEDTGAVIGHYRSLVVKLGYLYPELDMVATGKYIALTPGGCCLEIKKLLYKNINIPIYPIDDNVIFC